MSAAEYLETERAAQTKHELWDGEVFAVAGASFEHTTVIVEVLSDSTERFDRGEKFAGYRSLPTLVDYVLVAQDRVRVEHYVRGVDGTWVLRELGPGARLRLTGLGAELAVDDIYDKVDLTKRA